MKSSFSTMNQPRISVFLITLNEAGTIREVISSVAGFDEVVVVDSGSTDGTIDIAREQGAVVHTSEWLGYSKQKALAAKLCKHDWLLNIDGDEVVSPSLVDEIKEIVRTDVAAANIPINDLILGVPLSRFSRKRKIIRLFRRSAAKYPEDRSVHENLIIAGPIRQARSEIVHYGYSDPSVYFSKQVNYARLRAEDKYAAGRRGSVLKLLLIFPFTFIKVLVFRGLLFSRYRGVIVAVAEAMYAFLKEAYLIRLSLVNGNA